MSDAPLDMTLREPTEADHRRLARLVREWWEERPPRLDRLWFRHFADTSVIAEVPDGRPVAVGIGFRSGTAPERGVVLLVATARFVRRRGVGRAVVAAVEERLAAAGATSVEAVVWSGNRVGYRFFEALGYAPVAESLATPLYGVPAIADYDGEGEDRSVLERSLGPS